jgi:galactokinase
MRLYRAPGRVNLIGEHTDYNEGFVMPAALERYVWVAGMPPPEDLLHLESLDLGQSWRGPVGPCQPPAAPRWAALAAGVARVLEEKGLDLVPAHLLVAGDLPQGAGLASSAAFEVAVGLALLDLAGRSLAPERLALACQEAEHRFGKTRCGVMDQMASCACLEGHALFLDCRTLQSRPVPLPPQVAILVCDSMVRHRLADSEYNLRRQQCEEAARRMGVRALRDLAPGDLARARRVLDPLLYRRCRHVVTENQRALEGAQALQAGDARAFGRLMFASHESLRRDFEVSCPELDLLVECSRGFGGLVGARMTGGGFGGCTVHLVEVDRLEALKEHLAAHYRAQRGIVPEMYVCRGAAGASRVQ